MTLDKTLFHLTPIIFLFRTRTKVFETHANLCISHFRFFYTFRMLLCSLPSLLSVDFSMLRTTALTLVHSAGYHLVAS